MVSIPFFKNAIPLLAVLALSACALMPPEDPNARPVPEGTCHADAVAWAVGQPAEQEVMARVWRESGAGLVRPIAPGQAVPRDVRADRLNVHIDANNVITQVYCR